MAEVALGCEDDIVFGSSSSSQSISQQLELGRGGLERTRPGPQLDTQLLHYYSTPSRVNQITPRYDITQTDTSILSHIKESPPPSRTDHDVLIPTAQPHPFPKIGRLETPKSTVPLLWRAVPLDRRIG